MSRSAVGLLASLIWFLALLPLALWSPSVCGGIAVGGTDRVEAILPAGVLVDNYENDGYRLEVLDHRRVIVEVDLFPLESTAPYGNMAPQSLNATRRRDALPQSGEVARLARAVTAGSQTSFEAAARVLGWVSGNLSYHLDRGESQEPTAVLRRRTAFCTGFARVTVALLQEIGIEAREVSGLILPEEGSASPRFHRWVEIFYPDTGWVFSDPLATHNYVPATYVPLASSRVAPPGTGVGAVLRRQRGIQEIDVYPGAHPDVRARKNRPAQRSGALLVSTGDLEGQVQLEGAGVRRTLALDAGAATFTGVEPGRYHLLLRSADGLNVGGYVNFMDRERQRIDLSDLSVPPGGATNERRRSLR